VDANHHVCGLAALGIRPFFGVRATPTAWQARLSETKVSRISRFVGTRSGRRLLLAGQIGLSAWLLAYLALNTDPGLSRDAPSP
jgi:hypothetical protein